MKKTELWVTLLGGIATIATSLVDSGVLAPLPKTAAIVGLVAVVATYVAGRSWVKASAYRRPELNITTPPPQPHRRAPRSGV